MLLLKVVIFSMNILIISNECDKIIIYQIYIIIYNKSMNNINLSSYLEKPKLIINNKDFVSDFKKNNEFLNRKHEATRIIAKYPDRVPIICERANNKIPKIDKRKYLVPRDLTVGQFLYVIRKRIKLNPEQAIFCFINNQLPPTSALIGVIYEKHKDKDLFLYIKYSGESTFGN